METHREKYSEDGDGSGDLNSFSPELVGNTRRLTIGKLSGKATPRHKILAATGKVPYGERALDVANKMKEVHENGRKPFLKEEEFKRILKETGVN